VRVSHVVLTAARTHFAAHTERCEALLDAFRAYKASVLQPVQRNPLSSALVNIVALAGGDTTRNRRARAVSDDTPEERLADALEALSEDDPDGPDWHHGLAEPLGAALGAALLVPLADGLRLVGSRRHVLASRLEVELIKPVEAFVRDTLQGMEAARSEYLRRCRDAEVIADEFSRLGPGADAAARTSVSDAFENAAIARDAARATLSLAVLRVEGARRHVLVSSVTSALTAMHTYAAAVASDLDAMKGARDAAADFARQAAEQAQQREAAHTLAVQSFVSRRQAECDAAKSAAADGISGPPPVPGIAPVHEGWLMLRTPGGWARRYVVAHQSGELSYHRTREGALMPPTLPTPGGPPTGDAAIAPRSVAPPGGMWGLGSQLLRGAVSGARTLAETAGELATRVTAPAGSLHLLTASVKLGPPEQDPALRSAPFVFRVMSASVGASVTLQAESAAERAAWVAALQGVIAALLGGTPAGSPGMAALRAAPGNSHCADCGSPAPDWASLNLCVLLCHQCAGAHRRLGAAVSAVRSMSLDEDAWTPSVCAVFAAHGNRAANAVWAARLTPDEALGPDADMEARLEHTRSKYCDRLYVDTAAAEDVAAHPQALAEAAAAGDVARVLTLLAAGAVVNPEADVANTPLAAAVAAGSTLVVQALLLNGAHACGAAGDVATTAALLELVPGDELGASAIRDVLSAAASRQMQGRALMAVKGDGLAAAAVSAGACEVAVPPAAPPAMGPVVAAESVGEDTETSVPPPSTVPATPLPAAGVPGADDEDSWLQDAPQQTPGGTSLSAAAADDNWTE
jgi:hypothetical protein